MNVFSWNWRNPLNKSTLVFLNAEGILECTLPGVHRGGQNLGSWALCGDCCCSCCRFGQKAKPATEVAPAVDKGGKLTVEVKTDAAAGMNPLTKHLRITLDDIKAQKVDWQNRHPPRPKARHDQVVATGKITMTAPLHLDRSSKASSVIDVSESPIADSVGPS